jgi:arylsulfatase A-like enzyme
VCFARNVAVELFPEDAMRRDVRILRVIAYLSMGALAMMAVSVALTTGSQQVTSHARRQAQTKEQVKGQVSGSLGKPNASISIHGKQIPQPDPKFAGVIKEDATQSSPSPPPRVVPPKGAPNVLLIMTSDAGYGVPSTFGGVIPTPTLDRVARNGLRYTQMSSTALCPPTRAALITGRNHHSADGAIGYLRNLNAKAPDQPFFLYYVPGGSHSPHNPTREWIDKTSAMHLFDKGWNDLRETIFANQKRLGVIPAGAQLTPWPDELPGKLPRWDTLTAEQKKLYIKQAEVFAAYVAYTDHEIGRVIEEVERQDKLDNTLIIYISGDNGTSAEGTLTREFNDYCGYTGMTEVPIEVNMNHYDDWGLPGTDPHMSVAWCWAFDTPFKRTRQVASHFGCTRQGMAISWPARITDKGGIRTQFHHMIDIVPTILEAAGIQAPEYIEGIKQAPIEGVSMVYTFDKANANAPSRHHIQYFETGGYRGIYHDGWYADTEMPLAPWSPVLRVKPNPLDYKWELYNLNEDYTQNEDLSAKYPDKLKQLQDLFTQEASKYNVIPAR